MMCEHRASFPASYAALCGCPPSLARRTGPEQRSFPLQCLNRADSVLDQAADRDGGDVAGRRDGLRQREADVDQ